MDDDYWKKGMLKTTLKGDVDGLFSGSIYWLRLIQFILGIFWDVEIPCVESEIKL